MYAGMAAIIAILHLSSPLLMSLRRSPSPLCLLTHFNIEDAQGHWARFSDQSIPQQTGYEGLVQNISGVPQEAVDTLVMKTKLTA